MRISEKVKRIAKSSIFCFCIFVLMYSVLILFDLQGPTSEYDNKFINIYENIDGGGGVYLITGMYKSKGVISANKEVEFILFEVYYDVQKESFKDFVGKANIWPDNITVGICPDNARASEDLEWRKSPCINVILNKSSEDYSSVYYGNRTENKNNIEFRSSGQKALIIQSPFNNPHKENKFEIEPYSTYLQIQLQKYMYVLALLGFIVILIQLFEFAIKYLDDSGKG